MLSCDLIGPPVRLLRPRQEQFWSPYLGVDVWKQIPNLNPLSCTWGSPEVQGPVQSQWPGVPVTWTLSPGNRTVEGDRRTLTELPFIPGLMFYVLYI